MFTEHLLWSSYRARCQRARQSLSWTHRTCNQKPYSNGKNEIKKQMTRLLQDLFLPLSSQMLSHLFQFASFMEKGDGGGYGPNFKRKFLKSDLARWIRLPMHPFNNRDQQRRSMNNKHTYFQFSSVQLLSRVRLFATLWIAARQASLPITNSQSSPKLMSIKSVMPSSHLILCRPLLLLPPIAPSITIFSSESTFRIRWPKYWSFRFSISPSNEHPGLISFRMDWLDLLAVQGTLKSLLQHHSSKASILRLSAFFTVQLCRQPKKLFGNFLEN